MSLFRTVEIAGIEIGPPPASLNAVARVVQGDEGSVLDRQEVEELIDVLREALE